MIVNINDVLEKFWAGKFFFQYSDICQHAEFLLDEIVVISDFETKPEILRSYTEKILRCIPNDQDFYIKAYGGTVMSYRLSYRQKFEETLFLFRDAQLSGSIIMYIPSDEEAADICFAEETP